MRAEFSTRMPRLAIAFEARLSRPSVIFTRPSGTFPIDDPTVGMRLRASVRFPGDDLCVRPAVAFFADPELPVVKDGQIQTGPEQIVRADATAIARAVIDRFLGAHVILIEEDPVGFQRRFDVSQSVEDSKRTSRDHVVGFLRILVR